MHFLNEYFNSLLLLFYMFRTSYVHLQKDYIVQYIQPYILCFPCIYASSLAAWRICSILPPARLVILVLLASASRRQQNMSYCWVVCTLRLLFLFRFDPTHSQILFVVTIAECLVVLDLEKLLLKANNTWNFMSQIFENVAISSGKLP